MTDDPIRLREGGSSFLKKALESARADVPSDDRAAALESKILPLLLPPIPPAPPPGPGAAGAVKAGTAALVAKAGLGLAKGTMLAIAAAAVLAGAGVGAIVVGSSDPAPSVPSGVVSAPVSAPVGSAEPSVVLAPLPSVSAAPSVSAKPTVKPSASVEEADPALEPGLLRQAQDALRSNPAEALAKTQEHARKYPRGLLVQEREVIAIEALVKMGRKPEAEVRASRFERSFPGSTHARRIDAILGR